MVSLITVPFHMLYGVKISKSEPGEEHRLSALYYSKKYSVSAVLVIEVYKGLVDIKVY